MSHTSHSHRASASRFSRISDSKVRTWKACRKTLRGSLFPGAELLEGRTLLSAAYALNTIGTFGANATGANPQSALVADANGDLFGTAYSGGAEGLGCVFEIAKGSNTITTLASFNGTNGANPHAEVTLDTSGNLYGTTFRGGANNDGAVFEIAKGSNTITTLASFNGTNGANPDAAVTLDPSGNLYGTTVNGGPSNYGTVFEIAKGSNTITSLASFDSNGTDAFEPVADVTLDASGNLYGTTSIGGAGGDGTVFEIASGSNTVTTLASFNGTNGAAPFAGVTLDASGNLYGTTVGGGASNIGTVFEIASGSNTITTVASFNGANGANPFAGVTLDASGNLYGTTSGGGANNDGTVFEIASGSNTITSLGSFNGTNGTNPRAGVTLDASGNLYGTTQLGGASDNGSVFEIANGSKTINIVALFSGTNGANPYDGVTLDASGNLYGTTPNGGANNDGTVFEIAKGSNTITTFASFNGTNGAIPLAGVTLDALGNLYGTTAGGGDANGDGTVFEIAKGSNTITALASFNGTNGTNPSGGVTLDASGNLYGTSSAGGASGDGTVFEIPSGTNTITTLASFNDATHGSNRPGVTLDASGNLYGTTQYGGAYSFGLGTVFEIAKGSNAITTLASFNGTNGSNPYAGVTLDPSGNLYGTTNAGGASLDAGTVFEIAKGSNTITTLASFNGDGTNGVNPDAGVTLDSSGNLYGTATYGGADGANRDGTVFEIAKGSNTITTLASFNGANGANPQAGVTLDASGNLYGTTNGVGAGGNGTVFELSPIAAPPAVIGAVALSDSAAVTANQTQRSEIRNLTVTFSTPVTLGSNPFTLQRLHSGSAATDVTAALGTPVPVPGSNGTQWSVPILASTAFSDSTGSLNDGAYALTINAGAVTAGNVAGGTAMAASYTTPMFARLFGDYDGNGVVNSADYFKFKSAFGKNSSDPAFLSLFDYDGNGSINSSDYFQFKKRFGMKV